MKPGRERLDRRVVELGLAPTREKAQALILAGRIEVDGRRRDKPGELISATAEVRLTPGAKPYASRGGEKLAGVLDPLGIDPSGKRCLDVGSSTGGFTDVLLRRGAAHVTAVDVGRGLLEARLRQDPRVHLHEGLNARYLGAEQVDPPYDLLTADLSFISLTLVLPAVLPLVPQGDALLMVKPQFELTPRDVAAGGVVRDPALRAAAAERVALVLELLGWQIRGVRASPLAGPKGNREIFLHAVPGTSHEPERWRAMIEAEVQRDIG